MKLSDETIQQIVDDHAPSQGDPWDMAAMLRKAYALGMERMREAAAQRVEQWFYPVAEDGSHDRVGQALANSIRALPVE